MIGMWGAKLAQRRHLTEDLTRALIQSGQNQFKGQDQTSLDNILWPVAKYDVVRSFTCQQRKNDFKSYHHHYHYFSSDGPR